MANDSADDAFDHISKACLSSDELADDADTDLSRWEYLTRTFDHEGFFADRQVPSRPLHAQTNIGINDNEASSGYHTTRVGAAAMMLSEQSVSHPTQRIATQLYFDASNTGSLVLPSQTINYKTPGSDQPSCSTIASQVLRYGDYSHFRESTSSNGSNDSNYNPPDMTELSQLRGEPLPEQYHHTVSGQTYAADEVFDLEPIPFSSTSMSRPPQSVASLNETLHSFRRFSLATNTLSDTVTSNLYASAKAGTDEASSTQVQAQPNVSVDGPPKMCKPLSGYNYFYRVERDNIVLGMKNPDDPLPPPVYDFSPSKQEMLLYQHWHIDPTRGKRLHRKNHGKIEFSKLAKVIAHRWKKLPESGRAFYQQVAQADLEQYERYLAARRQQDAPQNR